VSDRVFVVRRGTTALPNRTVYDGRLSYAALGVLAVLLARPDGAPAGYRDLEGRGLGQQAMLKALRELDGAGYRHLFSHSGARGRITTDVIVSESPMTDAEAVAALDEGTGQGSLWAVDSRATVRRNFTHGATSGNAASAQVAPCGASPGHGSPGHGQPPHSPSDSNGSHSAPSSDEHQRACPHGAESAPRCALCRRGIGVADGSNVIPFDARARAAGEHLDTDPEEDA
jgi:hypothetical protein